MKYLDEKTNKLRTEINNLIINFAEKEGLLPEIEISYNTIFHPKQSKTLVFTKVNGYFNYEETNDN